VYAAESSIFLLAGVIVGVKILTESAVTCITTTDFTKLLGLYICMMLSRFGSIALFMPYLKKMGYGLNWKEVFVLTYGGLRGAIGISFALIIGNDAAYNDKLRQILFFDMAGNALLTLIINATTTGALIKSLGMCVTSLV